MTAKGDPPPQDLEPVRQLVRAGFDETRQSTATQ
jgi:hypothetical protein